jgi:hypothetical protein
MNPIHAEALLHFCKRSRTQRVPMGNSRLKSEKSDVILNPV